MNQESPASHNLPDVDNRQVNTKNTKQLQPDSHHVAHTGN